MTSVVESQQLISDCAFIKAVVVLGRHCHEPSMLYQCCPSSTAAAMAYHLLLAGRYKAHMHVLRRLPRSCASSSLRSGMQMQRASSRTSDRLAPSCRQQSRLVSGYAQQ